MVEDEKSSMSYASRILVLGATGLVGSSIKSHLKRSGHLCVLSPSRQELNLFQQNEVVNYFKANEVEFVFVAAAKVGGIHANNHYQADFLMENLQMAVNIFQAAFQAKVKKLLFLGSSCIYPRNCPQPMKEEFLLTSSLEPTNEGYALAKIVGLKLAQYFNLQYGSPFFSLMPTNLYGPNDNFHEKNSHVIPGLIRRFYEAKKRGERVFTVWGSGKQFREFLYVEDLARACELVMKHPHSSSLPNWLNVGSGEEIRVGELAKKVAKYMSYEGELVFDTTYPDGPPRKFLDSQKIFALGWRPQVSLDEGLQITVKSFLENHD